MVLGTRVNREVLVVTLGGDNHATHIATLLRRRGARPRFLRTSDFPASLTATQHRIGEIELGGLTSAWFRRWEPHQLDPAITDPQVRRHLLRESEMFADSLWDSLECRSVPAPFTLLRRAERKPYQLAVAKRVGFDVPDTLVTNDPDDLLDFYGRHDGQVIYKALYAPQVAGLSRPTQQVSTRDVLHAGGLPYAPVIVQEYVPKRQEIRVTVVGERLFAVAIDSQASNRTRFDWRRHDRKARQLSPCELPGEVAERCLKFTRRLGVSFGGIDLILTPDGRHVFLEINTSGQWLWLERATGLPISDALADLLVAG
ncbi:ATP-dependent carboxylate-amine ligase [Microbispora sp. NPDC046933]|uniref:ATP-dependent carboxylate-amine ligase n=1 Tax=Microbispora sp. NPDC046933 TaxID=3155618 RepID=UPI0033DD27D3